MALRNDIAEKKKTLIDGVEMTGLVQVQEIPYEKGKVEVPEFDRLRTITNNIVKVPLITAIYKIQKDTKSLTTFRNWFQNGEVHDFTIIRTDAVGVEFSRTQARECECSKWTETEFDAANPGYAKVSVELVPYEVVPMAAI